MVFALAIFYRYHLLGNAVIPFDSKDQYYPFALFVQQSLRSGEIPLWNPYLYSGTPAFADPLYMMFYPGMLLLLIPEQLTPHIYDMLEILHVLIGGISIFVLGRQLQFPRQAAFLSSVIFMLAGPLAGRVQHVAQIYAISLLPLSLLLLRCGLIQKHKGWFVLAGLVTGFALMIGYQVAMLSLLILLAYTLTFFIVHKATRKEWGRRVMDVGLFCLVVIGISAIQVLPSLEFARLSSRPRFSFYQASMSSMSPSSLFTIVFPNIYNTIVGSYWGPGDITETYLFVGMIPLFLVVVSILKSWKRSTWEQKFFFWTLLLALLYALGKYTPFYYLVYHFIPPLQMFKRTSEAFFVFHFALALTAGFGLKFLIDQGKEQSQKEFIGMVLSSIAFIAVVFFWALSWVNASIIQSTSVVEWLRPWNLLPVASFFVFISINQPRKWVISWILVGMVAIDLIATNSNILINSHTQELIEMSETDIYGNRNIVKFLYDHVDGEYRFEAVHAGSLWPNAAAVWRIPSTLGYSPLVEERYDEFAKPLGSWSSRDFSGLISSYNSPLLDLAGARYIVSASPIQDVDPSVDASKFREIEGLGYHVYENSGALPLAFVVHQAEWAGDKEEAKAILTGEDFNPNEVVVLETGGDSNDQNIRMAAKSTWGLSDADTVTFVKRSNNLIDLRVAIDQPGYLVVTDTYYPGWKAYIDGVRTDIFRADFAFKAVVIPAGVHHVEFRFNPTSFKIGAGISGITFALDIIYLLFSLVNSCRKPKQTSSQS